MLSFNGETIFFFGFVLKCALMDEVFKIFLNWCIRTYDCFYMQNSDEKLVKNHYFEDFETKKLLQKFSENLFLIQQKIHQKMQKYFQNVFSSPLVSSSKLKYSSSQKSSVSFSWNLFLPIFIFLDAYIMGLENV